MLDSTIACPSDPAVAYSEVTRQARNLEVHLAGTGLVGDNLGATLAGARSDALYAQVLFLFLGTPGAVLAGLLTAGVRRRVATAAAVSRRCSAPGARLLANSSGSASARLPSSESLGSALGLALAAVVGRFAFGTRAVWCDSSAQRLRGRLSLSPSVSPSPS